MGTPTPRRRRALAAGLGCAALLQVAAAVVLAVVVDWSWSTALDAFTVTNGVMGASFAISGALVAWHRPANAVGWLLLADGLGHATSAWLPPLVQVLHDHDGPLGAQRLAVTVFLAAWPWSIALFLPLALLLFPDGRLPGPRWRPVAWAIVLTSPLFVVEAVGESVPVLPGFPVGYLTFTSYHRLDWLWTLTEVRTLAAIVVALAALVVRFRTGDEVRRRQLLWLLLAASAVVAGVLPWAFVAGTPVVVLFSIPLVPAAITIAVVRHRLLDIRVVVSRALAWLLLSLVVLAAYGVLVALLDTLASRALGRSVLVTVVVALGAAPLLPRLQRRVDRWMYGDRDDPARVVSGVAEQLAAGEARGLGGIVAGVRAGLRLTYVGLATGRGDLVEDGELPERTASVPLVYAGAPVGSLEVGLRPGERRLAPADRTALELVATPLAVAVRALVLAADLQVSRERIVLGREEERRRLRRDLHDGLGPSLTGIALAADAASNLIAADPADPAAAGELVGSLRRDSRAALAEVRRLVDGLRPADLDELGLLGALRQRADQLARRADGTAVEVRISAPASLPVLPAAVEVAAYRIATEALTNVARHAHASSAALTLRCGTALEVEVTDDGRSVPCGRLRWEPGVGLQAMAERAAEMGALLEAGPSAAGGRVYVAIPLGES